MGHPEGGLLAHWSRVRGGCRLPQSGDGERDGNLDRVHLGDMGNPRTATTNHRGPGD